MEFEKFRPGTDGFWKLPNSECSVGSVLFIQCSEQFVMVQKQAKQGYEFSNLLALPGGMIRTGEAKGFLNALLHSLEGRIVRETGLGLECLNDVRVRKNACCPITSYSVKNQKKYTLVTSAIATVAIESLELESADDSISEASLQSCTNPPWERMSPANRLIIFDLLVDSLSESEKASVSSLIAESKKQCRRWAEEIGEKSQV